MKEKSEPLLTPEPSRRSNYGSVIAERLKNVREELRRVLPAETPPVVWEVGCGHGHFLTAYAAAHPNRYCIGVDIESSRIVRATKKRDRAQLGNLLFIRSEARLFLDALPPATRLAAVFVLFPDPWPKTRHHKHRVIQQRFLEALADKTTTDARLYFRTDHTPYFAEVLTLFEKSRLWKLFDEPWPFEFETVFQTRAAHHQSLVAGRQLVCKTATNSTVISADAPTAGAANSRSVFQTRRFR